MTSKLTREFMQNIISGHGFGVAPSAVKALAEYIVAAMDSEPHTDDELSNLLWYSQEATCHSDPNFYCEFQRLATPGFIAWIIRELQERRKADSEPVAYTDEEELNFVNDMACMWTKGMGINEVPLYRHAQQPVVPDSYVMVPIEPTEAMMLHNSGCQHHAWDDPDCAMRQTRRLIWAHMLAAAPQEVSSD